MTRSKDARRLVSRLAAAAVSAAALTGFSSAAFAATKIGIVVQTLGNPYFACVKRGAEEEAKKHEGVELTVLAGATGDDVAGIVRLIEDLMQKKVDVMSFLATDPDIMMGTTKKVQDAGIPVLIHSDDTREPVGKHYIGADHVAGGAAMAKMLVQEIGAKGKVAIIEGGPGNVTSELRKKAAQDEFAKYPGIKVVGVWNGAWDRAVGMRVSEDILTANPDLAGIMAVNDEMALGAVQAVRARNLKDKVKVTGFNGVPQAVQAVAKGDMLGTVVTYCYTVGTQIVRTALEMRTGTDPKAYTIDTGTVPVDAKLIEAITTGMQAK
ncbi:sugar ABC transporter substrate-binding protein [Ancylobacter sp. VNQ12]|uniref:sugar ABC transporter substrate-binding protein n=1 Tax=Ancylobacter sp. VNQ12 TaxID=3400920 RepID=UPI003C09FBD0